MQTQSPLEQSQGRRDPRPEVVSDQRPWGGFEQFTANEPSTVKILSVSPGQRLSLQRHENRDELWVVLDGGLSVVVGDREWTVTAGEQVWIPRATPHRLANLGDTAGRVLEIAFGHFDEEDIERLSDDYQR